jgi:hypothetical protein
MTHAIDPGRQYKKNEYNSYEDYVNNDVEFPAFATMFISKLKTKITDNKIKVATLADGIRIGRIPDKETNTFYSMLNDTNKKKFISYIYKEILS